jgi:hypothetical protein
MLVGLYLVFIVAIIFLRPSWMPALPPEARIYREADGSGGYRSLIVLLAVCAAAGYAWSRVHDSAMKAWLERDMASPGDEVLILSMTVAAVVAMAMAGLDRLFKLGLLSRLARQVTFVLIPPLVLIFLVLGTIFLGVATPTEGGAMGAVGALVMATGRGKFSFSLLKQALDHTARLSTFVLFILIGSTVFSFTFNAADGHFWVEHLFSQIPGGALGFLIVVNLLVFVLGMFLDFFEIADADAGGRETAAGHAAWRAGGRGDDLVRRDHRHEHADIVPDATVRFRAVLPAQRGAEERLRRPRHGPAHPGRHHRSNLQGLDRLHRAAVDHGGCAHRLPATRHRRHRSGRQGGPEQGLERDDPGGIGGRL